MAETERDAWEHLSRLTKAYNSQAADLKSLQKCIDSLRELLAPVGHAEGPLRAMELLSDSLIKVRDAIGAEGASLLAVDEDTNELVFVLVHGTVNEEKLLWRRIPLSQGVAGWVAKQRKPATVNNVKTDERFFSGIDREFEHTTKSIIAAPLISQNRVLGIVEIVNKRGGQLFNLRDETIVSIVAHLGGGMLASILRGADPAATFAGASKTPPD